MTYTGAGAACVNGNLVVLLDIIVHCRLDSYGNHSTGKVCGLRIQIQGRHIAIGQLACIEIDILHAIKAIACALQLDAVVAGNLVMHNRIGACNNTCAGLCVSIGKELDVISCRNSNIRTCFGRSELTILQLDGVIIINGVGHSGLGATHSAHVINITIDLHIFIGVSQKLHISSSH